MTNRKQKENNVMECFLACLLVFNQNDDTKKLLELYKIYTDDFSNYLEAKSSK